MSTQVTIYRRLPVYYNQADQRYYTVFSGVSYGPLASIDQTIAYIDDLYLNNWILRDWWQESTADTIINYYNDVPIYRGVASFLAGGETSYDYVYYKGKKYGDSLFVDVRISPTTFIDATLSVIIPPGDVFIESYRAVNIYQVANAIRFYFTFNAVKYENIQTVEEARSRIDALLLAVTPPTPGIIATVMGGADWVLNTLNAYKPYLDGVSAGITGIGSNITGLGSMILSLPAAFVSALIDGFTEAFRKASEESIKTGSAVLPEAVGHSPKWKTDLEVSLKPFIDETVASANAALDPKTYEHSALTPENAALALTQLGVAVNAANIAIWIAHAAAEVATLGQLEAVGQFSNIVLDGTGLKQVGQLAATIPIEKLILKPAEQHYNSLYTPEIPPYGDLVNMRVKEKISQEQFIKNLSYQGYSAEWANKIWDAHFQAPDFQAILQSYYRGVITREELDRLMIIVDYDPLYKNVWDSLVEQIPPYSELVNQLVKEVITQEEFTKYMKWYGFDQKWSKRIWDAHFQPPNLNDILTAWRRGEITEERVNELMVLVDLDPRFKSIFDTRKYDDPSVSMARYMFETGSITAERVAEIVARNGFAPKDQPAIVDFITKFQERRYRQRYLITLSTGYARGVVDLDELGREVKAAGYSQGVADWIVKSSDIRKEIASRGSTATGPKLLALGELKKAYTFNKINADSFTTDLLGRGYQLTDIQLLIEVLDVDKSSIEEGRKVVALSVTEYLNAFRYGVMTEDSVRIELALRGLSTDEVNTLIETKKRQWGVSPTKE